MPLMLMELGLSAWLFWVEWINYLTPLILVVLIWASTYFIQIPQHNKLGEGKDVEVIQELVNKNWIRTVLWTLKGAWLLWLYF